MLCVYVQPQDLKCKGRKRKVEIMSENVPPAKKPNLSCLFGTPAYRARARGREHCQPTNEITSDLTVTCESSSSDQVERITTIGYEKLTKADMDRLHQKRGWLNDRLINAGQILLKERFPDIGGLQNVDLARTLCFTQNEPSFVQILNTYDSHWVCVTSIGCKANMVKVYDSMRTGDVCISTKECIATLLNCRASCGLFALAYAYSLCEGLDPSQLVYESQKFRSHFSYCIKKNEMTKFDCKAAIYKPEKPLSTKFRVYCFCRLPNSGDKMVCCNSCSEWFHFTCVDLMPESKLGHCPTCTKSLQ